MATSKFVVADSSGLISLLKEDDLLHESAVDAAGVLYDEGWQLLVPHEVLAETVNVFGKKIGRPAAVEVADALIRKHDERALILVPSTHHVLKAALGYQRRAVGGPSFVDCLVMALADEYASKLVFGFDATFRKNGYSLPMGQGKPRQD